MTDDSNRQAGAEIEITPEMISAGVYELREHSIGESLERIVEAVYLAMRAEELFGGTNLDASFITASK